MLKKTLTYTNVDGVSVTENFYFNMTKAELLELELSEERGFKAHLEKIVASGKGADIIATFKYILRKAYGVRTDDGGFVKSPEAFDAFSATEAYSDLFFELVTDAKKSAEFVNAIMPAQLLAEVEAARQIQDIKPYEVSLHAEPNPLNMTDEEILASLGADESKSAETFITAGLTDEEILSIPPAEMRNQPRAVLQRAFFLKNGK